MIDLKLVKLVTETKRALKGAARPSEQAVLREQCGEAFRSLLEGALAEVPTEQKVAFFDQQAKNHLESLAAQIAEGEVGKWRDTEDEDDEHFLWEDLRKAVIGPKAFDATNVLEDIFRVSR